MTRIRKAIFPVAGLGTRFLPATKAMPKEMLPVVDRPLIQHVVDEARQAGIEHFIFVTGRNKSVIEDHFDRQFELELTLMERGKKTELALAVGRSAAGRNRQLYPPAVAARARTCGLVRTRTRRSRAFCAAPAGRARPAQSRLSRADDRCGERIGQQRQYPCCREGAEGARTHVRRRRHRRTEGQGLSPSQKWSRSRKQARRRPT